MVPGSINRALTGRRESGGMKRFVSLLLLSGAAWSAPLELDLARNFDQTVDLDGKIRSLRLLFQDQLMLSLVLKGRTHRLPLPTVADGLSPRGSVMIADFNFDGRKDIGIPSGVGYGGVNFFYKVYQFSEEKGGHFLPILAKEQVCNPKFSAADKTLICNSRSGPFWYGSDYRFRNGLGWLWRKREPAPSDPALTRFEIYSPEGKLLSSQLSSDPDRMVPIKP